MSVQNVSVEWLEPNSLTGEELKAKSPWLAGFVDADGSIGMSRSSKKYGNIYCIQTQIETVDSKTADEITSIFTDLGIIRAVCSYRRKKKKGGGFYRLMYKWNIARIKDNIILLSAILPYLVTKKAQALIALKYLQRRVNRPIHPKGSDGKFCKVYDGSEKETYTRLKELNGGS